MSIKDGPTDPKLITDSRSIIQRLLRLLIGLFVMSQVRSSRILKIINPAC